MLSRYANIIYYNMINVSSQQFSVWKTYPAFVRRTQQNRRSHHFFIAIIFPKGGALPSFLSALQRRDTRRITKAETAVN